MSSKYKFAAIFQTGLIKTAFDKIILAPVEIEYFNEPRILKIPVELKLIAKLEQGNEIFIPFIPYMEINLPVGEYISITVQVEEENYGKAIKYCNGFLDSTISQLSCFYDSALFLKQVYRGEMVEENAPTQHMHGMFLAGDPVSIDNLLLDAIPEIRTTISTDQDVHDRYLLMSKFFPRSLSAPFGDEKFLYLWTILEIFPMKGSVNIKPISVHLGNFMNKQPNIVKERLNLGHLCSTRGYLVHHGRLDIKSEDLVATLTRLELICIEVLRSISGLTYSGALDRYFI